MSTPSTLRKFIILSILSFSMLLAGCESTSPSASSSSSTAATPPPPSPSSTPSSSASPTSSSSSTSSSASSSSNSSGSKDSTASSSSNAGSSASGQQAQNDTGASLPGTEYSGSSQNTASSTNNVTNSNSTSSSSSSSSSVSNNSNDDGYQQGGAAGEASYATATQSDIGYGSGDDPFADLENGRSATMTTAERRAALDARLEEGYEVFDGMILTERENAQGNADDAGSGVMSPTGGGSGGGSETFGNGDGSTVLATGPQGTGGGYIPASGNGREGDFDNADQETYPVPDDIPNGNSDDVVARQLREAAMSEPDPDLREALWNEYRSYTGISQ